MTSFAPPSLPRSCTEPSGAGHLLAYDDDHSPYWQSSTIVLKLYRSP